jgi:hypothetical protein
MSQREDRRDPDIMDRHHQTNLVIPWSIIGSVPLDSGQALPAGRAPKTDVTNVKKIFR